MDIINKITFIFCFFFLSILNAQNCGCDVTISTSGVYTFTSGATSGFNLNVRAGQTVCIAAGNYNLLRFRNFIGTPTQPIIFKNCGGRVRIGHNMTYSALDFQGCRYFRATGTGDSRQAYGFVIDSSGVASAVSVGALSSDCEIDHIEVAKAGFAGIMAKTDPDCNSATWRANFTMYNVSIHDNFIHDVGGEGLYIGNSFFGTGMTRLCNGDSLVVYPHNIMNLKIYNNKILRTSADGLQYACAPNAQVYNNDITDTGIAPFAAFQSNGLQIGGGAGGNCYNNVIKNPRGSGLILIGHLGNNVIYNNLIINAGGDGIFADDRLGSLPNTNCDFINNTIVNSGRDAMRLYNQNNAIVVANNAMVKGNNSRGGFLTFQQNTDATQLHNLNFDNIQSVDFSDTINYKPLQNSFLTNMGIDATRYGVTKDRHGNRRPWGGTFDVGASEYTPSVISYISELQNDLYIYCYPNPSQHKIMLEVKGELKNTLISFQIIDVLGRIWKRQNTESQKISVDISDLPNGLYYVYFDFGKKTSFIKQ